MQAAITHLEIYFNALRMDSLVHNYNGEHEQAEIERGKANEIEQALAWLEIGKKMHLYFGVDVAKQKNK